MIPKIFVLRQNLSSKWNIGKKSGILNDI